MVHCCVPGCKNTHHHKTRGKDEWNNQDSRNYSLHDLPNEDRMEIRELWVMAINRTTLPKDVAVCSDHFTEDCFDEKWEEYKRKYGPTKVKRKLKLDAVPTIFPGRIFFHEKVQRIKENWKNKVLQRQMEMERLRMEREYKDRFKSTQTECQCKCKCRARRKNFSQQVNFSFKFMEDVGTQFPLDPNQTVKNDHSYYQGKAAKELLTKKVLAAAAAVAASKEKAAKEKAKAVSSPVSTNPVSSSVDISLDTMSQTTATSSENSTIDTISQQPGIVLGKRLNEETQINNVKIAKLTELSQPTTESLDLVDKTKDFSVGVTPDNLLAENITGSEH